MACGCHRHTHGPNHDNASHNEKRSWLYKNGASLVFSAIIIGIASYQISHTEIKNSGSYNTNSVSTLSSTNNLETKFYGVENE